MKTNKIEFTTANVSTAVPSLTQETEKLADCGGLGRREKMKLVLITEELAEAVKNLINY